MTTEVKDHAKDVQAAVVGIAGPVFGGEVTY
jgi:hypothetical protein